MSDFLQLASSFVCYCFEDTKDRLGAFNSLGRELIIDQHERKKKNSSPEYSNILVAEEIRGAFETRDQWNACILVPSVFLRFGKTDFQLLLLFFIFLRL